MNPESQNPRPELEARLTALLLGELPEQEAATLRQVISQDPELLALERRLKATIGLVRETAHPREQGESEVAPLRLSEERRQRLLAHFKTVRPQEFSKRRWWEVRLTVPVAAAAILIALLGVAMLLPALSRSKSRAQSFSALGGHAFEFRAPSEPENTRKIVLKGSAGSDNFKTWSLENARRTPMTVTVQSGAAPGQNDGVSYASVESQKNSFVGRYAYAVPGAKSELGPQITNNSLPELAKDRESLATFQFNNTWSDTTPAPAISDPTTGLPMNAYAYQSTTNLVAVDGLTKVPMLGDIPAFGRLMRSKSEAEQSNGQLYEVNVAGFVNVDTANVNYASTAGGPVSQSMEGSGTAQPQTVEALQQALENPAGRPALAPPRPTAPVSATPPAPLPVGGVVAASNGGEIQLPPQALRENEKVIDFALHHKPATSVLTGDLGLATGLDRTSGTAGIAAERGERERLVAQQVISEDRRKLSKDDVADLTQLALNNAEAAKQLSDAERKLKEMQRFAQILNMKLLSEGDSNGSKTLMPVIVSKAKAESSENHKLGFRLQELLTGKDERYALVKTERDQTDITSLASPEATSFDPYFFQTELEVMQSQKVLGRVVKDLNLEETWANKNGGKRLTSDQAVALLKKNLDLQTVPKSELIQVGVKAGTAEEAARLANAVAVAYRDYRVDERKRLSVGGIAALDSALKVQDKNLASAQAEVDRLRLQVLASTTNQLADAPLPKPAVPAPIPQPEVLTRDNAFSTFSLNVSDVSFKLAGASLEKGTLPEPNSIRAEEFINAFDYRDPEPAPGAPIAFAYERAQDPFAQNRDFIRFSIKTAAQGRQSGQPLNVVLLLDNSGSMERADRVRIIQEALRVLATQLHVQDTLSVVTFARTARLFVDGVPGDQAGKVAEEVSGLTPQGGTNLEEAMNLAYQTALRHYLANGVNRVVLLTDGAANLGDVDPESLQQKVEAQRKQGIALDCFGIGWEDYNDDLLEVLSRHGDGRYGFINTPDEAASEFAGQLAGALRVAAADVKVQVEFNPNRVTAYRQIGYAKHQLTKEQFRDNSVDAGELGAAEAGNALYVAQVNPAGDGPLATVRVRYKVPGTSDYREQEWSVAYTGATVALEQASPAMRLSAVAASFAERLASSPYASEVSVDRLLGYLNGVPDVYGADGRPRKLEWMLRQAKSLEGK